MSKITLLICFFTLAVMSRSNNTSIDSLINLTNYQTNDSILVDLYNKIGSASYRVDQRLASEYWKKALDLLEEKLKEKRTNYILEQLSAANNGMGIINRRLGNFSSAISYYQTSLKLNEELNDTLNMGYSYSNIGVIYRDLKEYDKALTYYNKSLSIFQQTTDTAALSGTYNVLGVVYRRMKEYDKALAYYNKSLALSIRTKDSENRAQSYNNIGVIHTLKENYTIAASFFNKGFEIHRANNNEHGIAKYHENMSILYNRTGNTVKAIQEGELAYQLFSVMGRKPEISKGAKNLSEFYSQINNHQKSLAYYKTFINYRDSIYNEKATKELIQKQMQFEFDKKMISDSLTRLDVEKIRDLKHKQQLKQQRIYMYGGGLILLMVLIFSSVLYKRLKQSHEQKKVIQHQKLLVEEKNKEILDSITYAKRIQGTILPDLTIIKESFSDFFVIYQPKDIISGDFYWFSEINNKKLIAVADCTGHGVPGAMISVVCQNALNRAVNDFNLEDPAQILDKTEELILQAFDSKNRNVNDGMDIALCALDMEKNTLTYAGAINSLFYVQGEQFIEIKGDRQPIGKYEDVKPFTSDVVDLKKGDKIYLFSDGYADQFGGEKGKKFMYKRFKNLIREISLKEFDQQKDMLNKEFKKWKKDLEQVDDICVVGIEV